MSNNSKWNDLGFASRSEYVGWLWFNGLTNDIKMYDDVYYDEYTGKIINISVEEDTFIQQDTDTCLDKYVDEVEEAN